MILKQRVAQLQAGTRFHIVFALIISMREAASSPHVLVVSFPSQGHVNPLLRAAKRIAAKGLLVTFTSSSYIGRKITASTGIPPDVFTPVGRGHLRFDFFSDGWEPNDPRGDNLDYIISTIRDVWPAAFADLIRRQADEGRPVACLVNNPFLPGMLDVATDMGIPCAVLWVQSCAVFAIYHHYYHGLADFPTADNPDVPLTLAGLPAMKPDEIPSFLLPSNPSPPLKEAILGQFSNLHKASWVLANSFEELEEDVIRAISEHSPIITVGPLVEMEKNGVSGDLFKAADCMEWLDAQEPRSVVYVSVGSVVVLSREEMEEVASGLRDARCPFLWVVRDSSRDLLPKGFVEETTGRGLVVGWSPQERVLAHGSLACFVTHCGWNSTMEALTAGVPVVVYPQWGDQITDAKFLVDVYGVGVRLRAPARREEVVRCVEEITTAPGAEKLRKKTVEWKEAVRAALREGGSSDRNLQAFVDEIWSREADKM